MLDLNEIYELIAAFDQIARAKGKQKEIALGDYKDNETVKKGLNYLLNPYMTYGVSEVKLGKQVSVSPLPNHFSSLFDICEWFAKSKGTTDAMLATLKRELDEVEAVSGDATRFVKEMLAKSLTLGVTATTVNKVFGKGTIPEFNCMLAKKYFEHPTIITGKEFAITQKLDGVRCLCFVDENQKITLFSRQGYIYEGLWEVEDDIAKLPYQSVVYDGELIVDNANSMTSGEGYKETIKIVRTAHDKQGVTYHIFDCVDLKGFEAGCDPTEYVQRRSLLDHPFVPKNLCHVNILPVLYQGTDEDWVIKLLEEARAKHQEGVMINLLHAPYVCKRTDCLLKVKVMQDCDLRIIGCKKGKGKNANTLGALTVDYKGNPVDVGCGYTDIQRDIYWEDRDRLIGRVITVQYFEESESDGVKSLRFPVFKELREKGKEVSYH